jgi:hypothetical protein
MSKWVVPDRRFKSGYRWTPAGVRAAYKWAFLAALWFTMVIIGAAANNGLIPLGTTVWLVWYAVHRFRANRRQPSLRLLRRGWRRRHDRTGSTRLQGGRQFRWAGVRHRGGTLTRRGPQRRRAGNSGCLTRSHH